MPLMLGAEYYIGNAQQRRGHNVLYTEPFSMIPGSLESTRRQLSTDPGIIKTGWVCTKLGGRLCGAASQ